jgi:choline dehydrogenase-like flavoprotein
VVGSGYGSRVAASWFARAGKFVCVLERGAEKWFGVYPHTASDAMKEYEVFGQISGRIFKVARGQVRNK